MTKVLLRDLALPALLIVLSACKSERSEDFIASGKTFLDKRDYPAAIIQLKNAVQKDAQSGEARYWLGVALHRSEDGQAAEIELRKAQAAGYDANLVVPELLSVLLDTGQYDKVTNDAAGAALSVPRAKADVLAAQATAELARGKLDEARRLESEAQAADPTSSAPYIVKARLAIVDQKFDQAQQVLADALAKAPDNFEALRLKADLTAGQGRSKEAIELYDRAVAIRPANISVYMSLVPVLLRERDLDGATARLTALKKVAGGATGTRYLEALVAYAKGDRDTAREAIRQVLKTGTDYAPALKLAGAVELDLGNLVLAEDALKKAVAAFPRDPQPRQLLTTTYLQGGQVKKARESLAVLLKIAPDSVAANILAGQMASAAREPAKAAEYFQKAVKLDPQNATSRAMLGATNLMRGETRQGISDLEAASASDPAKIEADVALVLFFLQQKQIDKATRAVEALEKKQPQHPQSASMRGQLLLAKGDTAGARKAFEEALAREPTFLPAATNLAALDMRDKKPEDAMSRYRSVLAKDPKQAEAALLLAAIMQRNGAKPGEIDKVLDDVVAANSASVPARLAQIEYLQQTNRRKEALDAAVKSQVALPDEPRLLVKVGRLQLAHGEYRQAAATFGNLAALNPQDPAPWVAQASAFTAAKEFTRARAAVGRAIEAQPDNLQIRAMLVDIGVGEKRYDAAIADARAIQSKWPKSSGGYIAEALVLADQRKTTEAEAVLRGALPTVDDAGVALQLFSLLVATNREAEADRFATDWIASKPKDAAMAAAAGEQSLARHDYATAVRWYRAGLKARPDNPLLLNNLAWALGQLKDPQALATAEKARSLAPNNAAIIDTVGTLQLQKGDAETAVTTLTRAARLAPNAPAIRVNLARALMEVGRKDESKQQLEAALAMKPSDAIKKEAEQLLGTL